MVNNFTNINKTSNHLLSHTIEYSDGHQYQQNEFSVSPNISVCKIEEALTSLDDIQPDNNCSVVKLYEQLGDGASDIGNFTHALEYYHKMVSLSIQLLHAINAYHH